MLAQLAGLWPQQMHWQMFWFLPVPWASTQPVQGLGFDTFHNWFLCIFPICYQGNEATFQIDQMFPVIVSTKQFLINYHYNDSRWFYWLQWLMTFFTNRTRRVWSCNLSFLPGRKWCLCFYARNYMQQHFKAIFYWISDTFFSTC